MIVQLSSGNGPLECSLAVLHLFLELQKEYGKEHVRRTVEWTDKKNPPRSICFTTDLDLSELEGTIQCTFHSPYRPNHKRKNWFVDVSTFEDNVSSSISPYEMKDTPNVEENTVFESFKSSGPGGQHVNKTDSGVRATYRSRIVVESTKHKSQYMNKKECIDKIRDIIVAEKLKDREQHRNDMWRSHERIERGNPVRIYEGIPLKRVR